MDGVAPSTTQIGTAALQFVAVLVDELHYPGGRGSSFLAKGAGHLQDLVGLAQLRFSRSAIGWHPQ